MLSEGTVDRAKTRWGSIKRPFENTKHYARGSDETTLLQTQAIAREENCVTWPTRRDWRAIRCLLLLGNVIFRQLERSRHTPNLSMLDLAFRRFDEAALIWPLCHSRSLEASSSSICWDMKCRCNRCQLHRARRRRDRVRRHHTPVSQIRMGGTSRRWKDADARTADECDPRGRRAACASQGAHARASAGPVSLSRAHKERFGLVGVRCPLRRHRHEKQIRVHRHDDLPSDHPHLRNSAHEHAHAYVIDELQVRSPAWLDARCDSVPHGIFIGVAVNSLVAVSAGLGRTSGSGGRSRSVDSR